MRTSTSISLLLATLLLAGCGDSGSTSGTGGGGAGQGGNQGGAGASGGAGGIGGATTTGPGGSGAGGMMLHPGVLVDRGLVARYYLDEAASGQAPTLALDAAPDPHDLTITYVNDADGEHMTYFEDAMGNRGLSFDAPSRSDRASAPIDNTKIRNAIEGGSTMTYEVVADIQGVDSSASRISHIGQDTDHTLSFESDAVTRLQGAVNDAGAGDAVVYLAGMGRAVYHMVVDISQAAPEERMKIYVNGGWYPTVDGDAPAQGAPITIGNGRHYVIGNREIGDRSVEGVIYYSAIYSSALTPEEIVQNAALLLVDDDTPSAPPQ